MGLFIHPMLSLIPSALKGIPALGIGEAPSFRSAPVRYAFSILALALVYYVAARASLHLAFRETNASPVWPPSGIAFSALLVFGTRIWPGIFLGAFAANLAGFLSSHGSLSPAILCASGIMGLGNSAEAAAAVFLAHKAIPSLGYGEATRGLKFGAIMAFSCALAAAAGTGALVGFGLAPAELASVIGRTWWVGDAVGILVVAPFLVSVASLPARLPAPSRLLEDAALLLVLVFFGYEVFARDGILGGVQPMAYAITPVLLIIAFRCHPSVAYLGLILVSGIAIVSTISGAGPFSGTNLQEELLLLQAFVGVVSLTLLSVEASLADRNAAARALKAAKESLEHRVEERTAEIRVSESRFRQFSDAGFEGLVIHDMGEIVLTNQAAAALFGIPPTEFIGKTLKDYLAPESIEGALANMRRNSEEPVISIGLRNDGTRFHMEVRGRPMEYNGKKMRVVAIRDISDRIKAEELQAHAMEALESANRAKSQFLATVSHEIRTPLNGIIGMTEALADTKLDADQQRYAAILKSCGEALLDQVNGILDLAKIESGSMSLEATGFDIGVMVEDALRPYAEAADRRGLRFVHASDIPAGTLIEGDPRRLRQVISNLVGNAVKFTSEGWIRVETRIQDKGGILGFSFSITDSGIGIEPATMARLFKPFVQGDASMSRRFGGTGLGLAICKQLVELMGGYLGVNSRPGLGSTFNFKCDFLAAAGVQIGEGHAAVTEQAPRPDESGKAGAVFLRKVLVVEDDPVNQEVARIFLHKHACTVRIVGTGPEAVRLAAAEGYDLILMDCQMPGMDGFETTAAIRGTEAAGRHARIVAMTANALQGDRERCLAAGMDDYLSKPLDAARLAEVIEGLGRRK